jgi:hypothetical protein
LGPEQWQILKREAMKTEANREPKLSERQYRQMLAMLADLTPAEGATLKDPDFIPEDEADLIVSDRRLKKR